MKDKVYVWDPLVRIFHWTLVIAFITSYVSGEDESSLHIYSGYLIAGLVTFRILWGFIGSKHARFSDFIKPTQAFDYLKGLLSGSPEKYEGHNPAGGIMVLLLLFSLAMTTISGMQLLAVEEGEGPFAQLESLPVESNKESELFAGFGVMHASYGEKEDDNDEHEYRDNYSPYARSYQDTVNGVYYGREDDEDGEHEEEHGEDEEAEEYWEELHEFFVNFTLLLVFAHLIGVAVSSLRGKENLVSAMVTGYKERKQSQE